MQSLLAPSATPEAPNEVDVSQPSDVGTLAGPPRWAFDSFLGLGVVGLMATRSTGHAEAP